MKRIACIAVLMTAVLSLCSCSKDDDKGISFNPSSVTLSVGESKTVSVTLSGLEEGSYNVQYSASPAGIISAQAATNQITVTGVESGSCTVYGVVDIDPDCKGSFTVTVK